MTRVTNALMTEEEVRIPDEELCGCEIRCGCFHTKRRTIEYFKIFNNPKGALFFLSFTAFLQGAVISGFYNINVSTLEKSQYSFRVVMWFWSIARNILVSTLTFGLRSSETGFISSSYDIAGCIAIPVFSYIGGTGHKPMWIASGTLIQGVGSIIFSLPHFIAAPYSIAGIETYDCQTLENCNETSLRALRGFFIVGQMLMGIGSTPLYTLALSYLDENVEQVQSSVYQGIFYASSLLGPGIGFMLGGQMLRSFTTLEDPEGISQDSALWIGNWWLGFLVVGVIFIILSIPLFMFPIRMPGTEKVRMNRENEIQQSDDSPRVQGNTELGKSIKDVPRSLLIFVKNRTMILISLGNSCDFGMLMALATFGPKYVESIFYLSPSDAAFIFGGMSIATACSAHLISGTLISKLRLTVTHMLRMNVVFSIISFGCLFVFLMSCANSEIAGVTVPYAGLSEIHCNMSACGCSTEFYRPVCGSDNLTYLSFCDAGCDLVDSENFQNCTKLKNMSTNTATSTATTGACAHTTCSNLPLFLVFVSLSLFFTFLTAQPILQTSLRIVPFSERSFTLGMQWLIIRIVGSIPMPIIYGRVLDSSCILWGERCGECESCHVYDNFAMATAMAWLNLVIKGMNICFLTLVNFSYKPSRKQKEAPAAMVSATSNSLNTDFSSI